MAETKGITIEFRGDTAQFEQAVKTVNGDLKKTKSEISLLNKQLKFDPKNVEALGKKFDLLKKKEELLKEQTDVLKQGLEKLDPNTKEWDVYNRQLQKAQYELQAISDEISKLPSAKLQVLSKEFEEWGKRLDEIGDKVENIGKKLSVLSVGIVGLATSGVKFNAQLEQYETAFTTLIGDAEKASKAISDIQTDASGTPFSVDALIEANRYLISAGVEADEARETILALGDAISATGGGSNELTRMASNLQQIKNLGKASSVDIKQFANAGINIYGLLAETTGKNVEQLKKMDISYDVLNEALKKASQEGGRYYNAMENQSQTLAGSVNVLKSSFSQLLGELSKSLVPTIKKVVDFLTQLIQKVREMSPEQQEMITRVGGLLALLSPLLIAGGKMITMLGGISAKFSALLKNERIVSLFAKLTANGSSLGGVLKSILTIIKGIISPVTIIIGILATLYLTNETIREQINGIIATLVNLFQPTIQLIINVLNIVWSIIDALIDGLKKMWDEFKRSDAFKTFIQIVQDIISWVQSLIDWISTLIGWLVEATSWFLNLIGLAKDFNGSVGGVTGRLPRNGEAISSGGYGSGGFNSGGLVLTTNFTVNTNNVGRADVKQWANWIADDINEALGRKIR